MTADPLRSRNLRMIGMLAALFMLPVALSFVLYFSGWRPAGQTIHGQLIDPARALPRPQLRDVLTGAQSRLFPQTWSLVYVGDGACEAACRQALFVMRQTRLLLNQDMKRVERVFLAKGACCDSDFLRSEHPDLAVYDASAANAAALLAAFPGGNLDGAVFIVDPLGNLVVREDANADPKGLLDDLRKLLRLSHIG